ncbi:MAG: isochorismatase family protein [Clostridia bacterium]|nr:isochorismatase family protein [Clostridia bacterium]
MKNFLIVVDIQNDFVNGALGTAEAVAMLPAAEQKIREWDGEIFVTYDTHFDDYMDSSEGKKLPVAHCIKGTEGWALNARIAEVLDGKEYTAVEKITFGSTELPALIKKAAGDEEFSVTLIGLCTDICVVSNALILKANFPEADISVDSACCAGVTPESHSAALDTMKMCQINII